MPQIEEAHPDFDLGTIRSPINYEVDLPSKGMNKECGLIFYINGYGTSYNDIYAQKLRRFFSDKYNCIVCTVDYFGSRCYDTRLFENLTVFPGFFVKLQERFGMKISATNDIPMSNIIKFILQNLHEMGETVLPYDMYFLNESDHYDSFSVLPALDHVQVMHELLQKYSIDKKRIFVLGTSYGGNIALFMNKIMPNTVRLMIDNSGFSSHKENFGSVYGYIKGVGFGVSHMICNSIHFSPNADCPTFFSSHHAALRYLEHFA